MSEKSQSEKKSIYFKDRERRRALKAKMVVTGHLKGMEKQKDGWGKKERGGTMIGRG